MATHAAVSQAKRRVMLLHIDQIVPDVNNPRKQMNNLDELARSIRSVGIIEPPVVQRRPDGRFIITAGERRWRAARLAGATEIPVVVIEDENSPEDRRVLNLVSNLQRESLSPIEVAQCLKSLKTQCDPITNRELALLVGKSEQWIGQMLKIAQLPEELASVFNGASNIAADVIVEIARLTDRRQQIRLAHTAVAGLTVRGVREHIRSGVKVRPERTRRIYTAPTGRVIIEHSSSSAPLSEDLDLLQHVLAQWQDS